MRKKIEELRNREEGFTLVELLAVIVILGIIVVIAVPAIGNVVSDSRKSAETAEQELIIDAARLYFIEQEKDGTVADGAKVTTTELEQAGFLETDRANNPRGTVTREAVEGGGYSLEFSSGESPT